MSRFIELFHTDRLFFNQLISVGKSISIGLRVTPEFKGVLELAAKQEQRSKTNLLEKLLVDHCRARGLLAGDTP